jgi:hypothetical protein
VILLKLLKILTTRVYTNVWTLLLIAIGLFSLKYCSGNKTSIEEEKTSVIFLKHLDSLEKRTNALIFKIDSLDLLKKQQLTLYYKTQWKYDTLKTIIDTMPPLDGTKLLLSKSRQLTNQGIE